MNLWQDLRFAVRMLIKDRWFTIVTVVTLAVGIGLNATVFALVSAVLIRDLPFSNPDRVVSVGTRDMRSNRDRGVSYSEFDSMRHASVPTLQGAAAYAESTMNVSDGSGVADRYVGCFLGAPAFRTLGIAPFLGRDFEPADDLPGSSATVILSHGLWTRRFGSDPAVLGRVIRINGVPSTVIGVMPPKFQFPLVAELWRPLAAMPGLLDQRRDARTLGVAARLADGVTVEQAQADLVRLFDVWTKEFPETTADHQMRVIPFSDRYIVPQLRIVFLALLGAVGFVLLVACANVASLLIARGSQRLREVAIRTAMGASRRRIIRQLLVESLLLSGVAGALGLWLSVVGVRVFAVTVEQTGKPFWLDFMVDWTAVAYLVIVCAGTGIVFGLLPALQVSSTNANDILKEGGRSGTGGGRSARWTNAMVVAELALTLVLLSGAGYMMRSFLNLYQRDVGVDTTHLLTVRLELPAAAYPDPEQRAALFSQLHERLSSEPLVSGVAIATAAPAGGGSLRQFATGAPAAAVSPPMVTSVVTGEDYFETLRLQIPRGRALNDSDGLPGRLNVVINERLASMYFAGSDPVGRTIRLRDDTDRTGPFQVYTVVGVSETVRQRDLDESQPDPVVYVPSRSEPPFAVTLLLRSGADTERVVSAVRRHIRGLDPDLPLFNVMSLDEALAQQRWPYRVFGGMFVVFALFALALSMVGLYAVTSYSVAQRTQEIGIRMACGAQVWQVSWLIARRAAIQLGIGVAIGLVGAVFVGQALSNVLVGTGSADVVVLSALIALMSLVAFVAVIIPSRRAARLQPTTALNVN